MIPFQSVSHSFLAESSVTNIFVAMFWHPFESVGQIPTDGMQMLDNIKLKHSYINLQSQQKNIRVLVFLLPLTSVAITKLFTVFQPDKCKCSVCTVHYLMIEICSKKCVVRQFHCFASIMEFPYTNLGIQPATHLAYCL